MKVALVHSVRGTRGVLFALALLSSLAGMAQNFIDYEWPLGPAPFPLNCDTGCTANSYPVNGTTQFTGTNFIWVGVDRCPMPETPTDAYVETAGWTTFTDTTAFVLMSGIAWTPMYLDSIIIRHRAEGGTLERLKISLGMNNNAEGEIADVATSDMFIETIITNQGCVEPDSGMIYGFFQLMLQPYQGYGNWSLDQVRIVATPCLTTGIHETVPENVRPAWPLGYDWAGRRVR